MSDKNSETGFHFVGAGKQSERNTGLSPELGSHRAVKPGSSQKSALQQSHGATQNSSQGQQTTEVPGIVEEVLRSPGQPLDRQTRELLEPRFGHDFSKVRVHADSRAAQSASSVNALAYTVGHNIVFDRGQYHPRQREAQKLLAHELTHVVQQSRSESTAFETSSAEKVAEQTSERVASGQNAVIDRTVPHGIIQRQAKHSQNSAQNQTDEFGVARSIIRGASDEKRDVKARAVEAVWRIIHEYYPNDGDKVRLVSYDNKKAGTGLKTYDHQANKTSYGEIYVGKVFLDQLKVQKDFARAVLQVGHELEHIDQYRAGMHGPTKKDEREFRAFYHEALGVAKPHTGRVQHSMRIDLIDTALRYYNCLDKPTAANYANEQKELLDRRAAEIQDMKDKGYGKNVPTSEAPKECRRQEE